MAINLGNDIVEISSPELIPVKPKVSVLMITYNHESFLEQAIEGVISQQTNFPFELVIGEDNSADHTRQIVIDYQSKYPNIIRVLYSEKNIGANKNFARTLSACRGEFVAICEGDDFWNDNSKLQKQIDFLVSNKQYVICYHDAVYLNKLESGQVESLLSKADKRDFSAEELMLYSYMPTVTACFRNLIKELPSEWFKVVNADTFLISLLGQYGGAKYIPEIAPARYREHAGGIWSGLAQQDKTIRTITTFYWLTVYYNRVGNVNIASKFACATMDHVLSTLDIEKSIFLKWFLIKYFLGIHHIYWNTKKFFRQIFA